MKTPILPAVCLIAVLGSLAKSSEPGELAITTAVPRVQVIPLPHHQASFQYDGRELLASHFDPSDRRPFWYPIRTADDASLTRMGHPHDALTHSHHNSLWIAHSDVDGVNYWGDLGKDLGRIVNVTIPRDAYADGADLASMTMINHWVRDDDASVQLIETRRAQVVPLEGAKSWLMVVDLAYTTPAGAATTFRPSAFGLMAVRMAKSIGVRDGGGRILNSDGLINEAECFRKPAKWCDYSGRISNGEHGLAGIVLMNHPMNPQHPTPFHVRDDGWMGACLNFERSIHVSDTKPLKLRYGLWVHSGAATVEEIETVWTQFAERAVVGPNDEAVTTKP